MSKLIELIRKLVESGFFGRLEISFENGRIVVVKKTETIKLDK